MKIQFLAAALVLSASVRAAAQEKDDVFKGKGVKMGDRVELTLRSGFAIRGKLVQVGIDDTGRVVTTADPAVDLAALDEIIIDMTMEYPDISGVMGVERVQIREVRKRWPA